MRFRPKNTFVWLLALGVPGMALFAQDVSKVGTTAAKFLTIPVGSRSIAMGGAFVSLANDMSALYWNPSGLARIDRPEVLVSHSRWLADIRHDFAGIGLPFGDFGTIGFSVTAMTMPDMEVTTEAFPEGTGEMFSATSYAFGFSYARNLTDWFSIGATVKYVRETIYHSSSGAFAVDIGTLFTTPFQGVRLGVSITNFGEKLQIAGEDLLVQKDIDESQYGNNSSVNAYLSTDKFDLPLALRLSLSGEAFKTDNQRLTIAVDASHPNDNTESVNAGFEYSVLNDLLMLRGGVRSLFQRDTEESYTFGGGTRYNISALIQIRLDYAYQSFGRLKNVHTFSLGLQF
ncbi:MAG: PorV/PorQ family protein [Ignavibacteria bacterium]|nr:PorV/PorQ family protein [Ignavibacteria bacterium]